MWLHSLCAEGGGRSAGSHLLTVEGLRRQMTAGYGVGELKGDGSGLGRPKESEWELE